MNIFWNIFELAVNIFEAANAMCFVCIFLNGSIRSKKEYRYWIVGSLIYATTTTVLNNILDYEGVLLFIYIATVFLYSLLFLSGTVLQKLFISVFQLACIVLVSNIITNLVTSAVKAPLTQVYSESGWIRLLTVVGLDWLIISSITLMNGRRIMKNLSLSSKLLQVVRVPLRWGCRDLVCIKKVRLPEDGVFFNLPNRWLMLFRLHPKAYLIWI